MPSDQDRLTACWRILKCDQCIHDSHGCGWCYGSSICVPASSLLDPLTKANVCPLPEERFELRTKALGCGCSTATLLSIVVTVFTTIAVLLVLSCIAGRLWRVNKTIGTGTWRGTEIEIKDGNRFERDWKRGSWFAKLKSHLSGGNLNAKQISERSRLLG